MKMLTGTIFLDAGRKSGFPGFSYRNILLLLVTFQVIIKINFTIGLQFTCEYFPSSFTDGS